MAIITIKILTMKASSGSQWTCPTGSANKILEDAKKETAVYLKHIS